MPSPDDHQELFPLGLGLAALGRPEYINVGDIPTIDKTVDGLRENMIKVMDFAYKSGVRYFDAAPSYGKAEDFLFEWITSRGHTDMVLDTKWGYTYIADWKLGHVGPHEIKDHSLKNLILQWQSSKNLLPNLWIYQIHSATLDTGILTDFSVLKRLHQIKKETGVKIGVTTSGPNQKQAIIKARSLKMNGEYLFDVYQVTYNILDQDAHEVLRRMKNEGRTVIIKEALANGRVFPNPNYPHYRSMYDALIELSHKHGVGIDAVALRFCLDMIQPDIVLSGALGKIQLAENLKVMDIILDAGDLDRLGEFMVTSERYWSERSRMSWD